MLSLSVLVGKGPTATQSTVSERASCLALPGSALYTFWALLSADLWVSLCFEKCSSILMGSGEGDKQVSVHTHPNTHTHINNYKQMQLIDAASGLWLLQSTASHDRHKQSRWDHYHYATGMANNLTIFAISHG